MQRLRVLTAAALLAALPPAAQAQPEPGPPPQVEPGGKVPPMMLRALMPGDKEVKPLDLGASLGRRPLVVCYVVLGESLGEEMLMSLQALADGPLKGKVVFLAATRLGRKVDLPTAVKRISLLGVTMPVVVEEDFALGAALAASTAPSISLIDAAGILRVRDAKSLKQEVARGVTFSETIQKAARREPVPTVTKLPRYYPAYELVGEQFPDFMLKGFKGTERIRLSEVVERNRKEKKLTALFFWHPNCKHCKQAMPGIMVGYHSYRKWLDIVSVVDVKDADEARNCEDTIRAHKITFPVLEDEGKRVTDLYKVVSTPTFFFVRPDGVIDSAYTSGNVNYVTIFSARIVATLGAGPRP